MERLLENKAAIVTGGGRGLGLAISLALAGDGARVAVVSRSVRDCEAAVELIAARGASAVALPHDITAAGAPEAIIQETVARLGGVDILVNCAGVFFWKKLFDLTPEDWERTLATNLTAPFHMIRAAAKVMIDRGRGGSIINITSIHGAVADPNVVAHCASKFGLEGLTRATAESLREFNIRVNAIAPGSIEPDSAVRRGDSVTRRVTQADVATLAAFLASDYSKSLTGMTLPAYGSTRTVIKA